MATSHCHFPSVVNRNGNIWYVRYPIHRQNYRSSGFLFQQGAHGRKQGPHTPPHTPPEGLTQAVAVNQGLWSSAYPASRDLDGGWQAMRGAPFCSSREELSASPCWKAGSSFRPAERQLCLSNSQPSSVAPSLTSPEWGWLRAGEKGGSAGTLSQGRPESGAPLRRR